jgi:hypothetical protein
VKARATAKKTKTGHKPRPASPEPLLVRVVAIDDIDPSPLNRSARNIDDLAASVREHGVQQPIKVRPRGSRFEIVYGERRYRAAKQVGLKEVPATVEELTDEEAHELITVKIPLSAVTGEVISELEKLTANKKGKSLLRFDIYDLETNMMVNLFSRNTRIEITDELLAFIENQEDLAFKIN